MAPCVLFIQSHGCEYLGINQITDDLLFLEFCIFSTTVF